MSMRKKILGAVMTFGLGALMLFPVPASAAEGTDGTEMQVLEAEQLEIQLGADWAGVEFELKTDAGMYPGTIAVGEDGVLRMEIGGSSSYILTCLNSSVTLPEPAQASAIDEEQSEDGQTEKEAAEEEDAGEISEDSAADPETVQEPGNPEAEESEAQENTIAGIPVVHIIVFAAGMVLAVGCLITMYVLKKRRENLDDDDQDTDYEEDD